MQVKPGMRVRSAVCATEVMVVKGAGDLDLRCGGVPMESGAVQTTGAPQAPFDGGTLVGKRYSLDGVEVLCTKAGAGSLSLGATPLPAQDAQQ
ncbi:MAG: hypothetical protein ACO3SP_08465, partial [Ilumatobacteraceae bacterium]